MVTATLFLHCRPSDHLCFLNIKFLARHFSFVFQFHRSASLSFYLLLLVHRGLSAETTDAVRRDDLDADLDDSEVAYIARSKRDVAEHFGVAWSTMQPRLVGKIGAKVRLLILLVVRRSHGQVTRTTDNSSSTSV